MLQRQLWPSFIPLVGVLTAIKTTLVIRRIFVTQTQPQIQLELVSGDDYNIAFCSYRVVADCGERVSFYGA